MDPLQLMKASPLFGRPESRDRKPASLEEAAEQFEAVLVRQFVKEMTKDLFKSGLDGEAHQGWMGAQASMQSDVMVDVLTRHLVESKALNLSELMLRQWKRGASPDAFKSTPVSADTHSKS